MYPTSAEFDRLVRESHTAVSRVDVLIGGEVVGQVKPTGGQVTIDRNRAIRRLCSAEFVDDDGSLVPASSVDYLTPYGNELALYRGIRLASGADEMVPLGIFGITGVSISSETGSRIVSVEGADRSRRTMRNRFTTEYQTAAGVDLATVIRDLILDRDGNLTTADLDLIDTGWLSVAAVLEAGEDSDPWRDAQALAAAGGYELAFAPDGRCRLYLPSDGTGTADATYTDTSQQVLLGVKRDLDTETTYNGVIASGEGSALLAPVRGEAWDLDPASPTYRYGPFGEVPFFYVSPFFTEADQAIAAATSRLATVVGGTERVEWTIVPNPAHDVDDLISLTEAGSKTTGTLLVDSLTIPLGETEPMTIQARSRRTT